MINVKLLALNVACFCDPWTGYLDHFYEPTPEGKDRHNQLGGVAEGGIQEASDSIVLLVRVGVGVYVFVCPCVCARLVACVCVCVCVYMRV